MSKPTMIYHQDGRVLFQPSTFIHVGKPETVGYTPKTSQKIYIIGEPSTEVYDPYGAFERPNKYAPLLSAKAKAIDIDMDNL